MSRYSVFDLFCGLGGLSIGFRWAGFRVLGGLEKHQAFASTYKNVIDEILSKHCSDNGFKPVVLNEDIENVSPRDVFKDYFPDVIIGGPPCQGFSVVGRIKRRSLARAPVKKALQNKRIPELETILRKRGMKTSGTKDELIERITDAEVIVEDSRFIDDPRNVLYKRFIDFVRDTKPSPRIIMIENVPGLLSYKNGKVVRDIRDDFRSIGYEMSLWDLNAMNFGVPQMRRRIFFVGMLNGMKVRPPRIEYDDPDRIHDGKGSKGWYEAGDAILDLPALRSYGGSDISEYEPNGHVFNSFTNRMRYGTRMSNTLYNQSARYHNNRDLALFQRLQNGELYSDIPEWEKPYKNSFQDKYKVVREDRPSHTVTAHICRDGLHYIHPTQLRSITPREAARLQSIPDRIRIEGTMVNQYMQIGNAVPPLLARAIGRKLLYYLQKYR